MAVSIEDGNYETVMTRMQPHRLGPGDCARPRPTSPRKPTDCVDTTISRSQGRHPVNLIAVNVPFVAHVRRAANLLSSLLDYQMPTACPTMYRPATRKPRTSSPYLYTR